MSEVKHDYLGALNWFGRSMDTLPMDVNTAIIHALKLAAVVTGELSEGEDACSYIFKAMIAEAIAQAEKEIG